MMKIYEYKTVVLETTWEDVYGKWYERDFNGVDITKDTIDLIEKLYPSYEIYDYKMKNGDLHIKIRKLLEVVK